MRSSRPVDFLAYRPHGRLVAAIEVSRKTGSTPVWAVEVRDALLSSNELGDVPYFVLVAADRIYIWRMGSTPGAPPSHVAETSTALDWYFRRAGVEAAAIHGLAFETLVGWWLSDLTSGDPKSQVPALAESGLLTALEGSEIDHQDAA